MKPLLPEHIKPRDLANHLGVSERTVRKIARDLGACRIIGKEMIFLSEDLDTFMEGIKQCPLDCKNVGTSGTTQERLPGGDYAALRDRLTKPSRKGSRRKSSTAPGNVVSMGRGPD